MHILVPHSILADSLKWLTEAASIFDKQGLNQRHAVEFRSRAQRVREALADADAGIVMIEGVRYRNKAWAAKRLGINTGTLANWRSAGRGPPYIKHDRRVLYGEADVENWITAGAEDA